MAGPDLRREPFLAKESDGHQDGQPEETKKQGITTKTLKRPGSSSRPPGLRRRISEKEKVHVDVVGPTTPTEVESGVEDVGAWKGRDTKERDPRSRDPRKKSWAEEHPRKEDKSSEHFRRREHSERSSSRGSGTVSSRERASSVDRPNEQHPSGGRDQRSERPLASEKPQAKAVVLPQSWEEIKRATEAVQEKAAKGGPERKAIWGQSLSTLYSRAASPQLQEGSSGSEGSRASLDLWGKSLLMPRQKGESRLRDKRGGRDRDRHRLAGSSSSSRGGRTRSGSVEAAPQENSVFVGDMNPTTTIRQLEDAFSKFGEIVHAKIIEGHCYGFVTFKEREPAEKAVEEGADQGEPELDFLGRPIIRLRGVIVNGKTVRVSWAHGSMPEWKIGVGGFVAPPTAADMGQSGKIVAAAVAARATAEAVLQGYGPGPAQEAAAVGRGREVVAYDDLF